MFISKTERMDISQRIYVLEEMAKNMGERIRSLEATTKGMIAKDEMQLEIRAKKLMEKKERQREYNRKYKARLKAEKAVIA
jgi:hypothetical protein